MAQRYTVGWLFLSLKGRIRRKTYALSGGFLTCLWLFVLMQIGLAEEESAVQSTWLLVFLGLFCVSFWSMIALSVKRLHDIGVSGIAVFVAAALVIIPFLSLVGFTVLCLWPGMPGANRFGEDPVTR